MRFMLDGKIYSGVAVEDLSLRALLDLERESAELGRTIRTHDIETISDALAECVTDEERSAHPDGPWLLAITIWAARRLAGDGLSFADAIDFPLSKIQFLPDPEDHKRPANPTRPPVSAEADAHHVDVDLRKIYEEPYTAV